jgi:hypothetical protein
MSSRALAMFRYLADAGEVPLHVLVAAFWPDDEPAAGEANARRWLSTQQRAGNIQQSPARGPKTTVRLSRKMAAVFQPAVSAAATGHPRARAHHAATLQYVEQIKAGLGPHQRLASVTLEPQLRAAVQAGQGSRLGETYEAFPDAVIVIEEAFGDGTVRKRRVAVEYVTSKYTSQDILDKAASFDAHYDGALWVADKVRTKERVERLVGGSCACLT